MPPTAVVAISDLHLGRRNRQDSFLQYPEKVVQFGKTLAIGASASDFTLVLNGDVFDLWELVTDAELRDGPEAYEAIRKGLRIPAKDQEQVQRLAEQIHERLQDVIRNHPEFCDMVAAVAAEGGKVHFNVGNHDHQLDNAKTAAVLLDALGKHCAPNPREQVSIGRYYLNPKLGFYAEHGDQFAEAESRSPLFDVSGDRVEEAPGFYFLRFMWNRVENQYEWVMHPNMGQILELIARTVFTRNGPVQLLLRYLPDYFRAVRDKSAVLLGEGVNKPPLQIRVIRSLYNRWVKKNPVRGPAVAPAAAAANQLTEEDFDAVRAELGGADPAALLAAAPERERAPTLAAAPVVEPPVTWLPGLNVEPNPAKEDDFVDGLRRRLAHQEKGFPPLQRDQIHTMTLGHTHNARQLVLFPDARSPHYFNSGSWTRGNDTLYVWAFSDGSSTLSGMRKL